MPKRVFHSFFDPQLDKVAKKAFILKLCSLHWINNLRIIAISYFRIIDGQEIRHQPLLIFGHIITVVFDIVCDLLNSERNAFLLSARLNTKCRHDTFRN